MATEAQYTFNIALTEDAMMMVQNIENFIATKACSMVKVNKKTGTYKIWSKDDLNRDEVQLVKPGSAYPYTTSDLADATYNTEKYGLDEVIDQEQEEELSGSAVADVSVVQYQRGLVNQDSNLLNTIMTTGVFGNDKQGTVNFTKWDDEASDPINDVITWAGLIEDATGLSPNSMIISEDVVRKLRTNASILDRLSLNTLRVVNEDILSMVFGIPNIYIAKGIRNTSNKANATQTTGLIGTKKCLLYHKGLDTPYAPSALRMFVRNYGDLDTKGIGILTKNDWDKESIIVRVKSRYHIVVPASSLGVYAYDVIA